MRIAYFLLSIAGIVPSTLWGQADVRQQLQAFALQRQGHFDKVINDRSIARSIGITHSA